MQKFCARFRCRRWVNRAALTRRQITSGLPPKAEIFGVGQHVSNVPRAEVGHLFDHLVGQQLERVRHGETEGGGGLEIND
jgi:hypothetical protein